jgi:protein SCO1/2
MPHGADLPRPQPRLATGGVRTWIGAAFAAVALGASAAQPAPALPATPPAPRALDEAEALQASTAAIGRQLPEFTLRDRRDRPVALADYRGRPLLVSFIYTGCFQVCPMQTRALQQALQRLEPTFSPQQYRVVSIGFNQPFDSPTAMRAFSAQHGIGASHWEFLSPRAEDVPALTEAFGFRYAATPAGFEHVLGVSIVDAEGRIRAQVLGDRLRPDQLGEPLRALLGGAPLPPRAGLAGVVDRVRILCSVYDPATGRYRTDWKLVLELVGGALFFISVPVYVLAGARRRARHAAPPATGQPA